LRNNIVWELHFTSYYKLEP